MSNPLGWLASHVSCNLAIFHDAGVRFIRRILVHVEPGPHDSLVVDTADHLARVHGAELVFARFVPQDAALTAAQSAADYLDQVRQLSAVESQTLLLKGHEEMQTIAKQTAAFELLVIGARPLSLRDRFFGSARDRLTERAACSVLRVQTPQSRTHEAFARRRDTVDFGKSYLMQFLESDCVQVGLESMRKEALFSHFAHAFAAVVDDVDASAILAGLWERERMQNTSVGRGLALPHATIPTAGKTRLGIFTLKSPTSYQAPDGADVDTFFVTLGPASDRQTHLKLLATVAKMVIGTTLLPRLRDAESPAEIVQAIEDAAADLRD
jgi:mannitol/fructose-specific phosphotransferase system IIA component (Ntr-type)/nucleotide-binding universal stress UspA family protein